MYRRALRAHRALLITPVVVAAVIAGWCSFGAAPSYRSTASIWVDNSAAVTSSIDANTSDAAGTGAVGPATLESYVVGELLQTPGFATAVATGSQLVRFDADGDSAGGFSPTVLISRLRQRSTPPEARAISSVVDGIQVSVAGPQVLNVSYDGPSPAVAQSVVNSLVEELKDAAAKFRPSLGAAAQAYYARKVKSAMQIANNTRGALSSYLRAHPGVQANDPAFTALSAEARTAAARLATDKLNTAQANTEAQAASGALLSVIDRASLPQSSTIQTGTRFVGVLAGIFSGVILSLAFLLVLAPEGMRPWDAEMPTFERLAWPQRRQRSSRTSA